MCVCVCVAYAGHWGTNRSAKAVLRSESSVAFGLALVTGLVLPHSKYKKRDFYIKVATATGGSHDGHADRQGPRLIHKGVLRQPEDGTDPVYAGSLDFYIPVHFGGSPDDFVRFDLYDGDVYLLGLAAGHIAFSILHHRVGRRLPVKPSTQTAC